MTREEACLIGFRIIQTSGMAKNELFAALEAASSGNYDKAQKLIDKANSLISRSQSIQDAFIVQAKNDEDAKQILKHGQNYVQATQVFRDYVLDLTRVKPASLYLPAIYHYYA